jgi:hypothetical protein
MIQTVSPLRSLVDRELLLIDHSSRFKSVVLSVACYAIGLTFLVGIAQVLLLKNQLINKKVI